MERQASALGIPAPDPRPLSPCRSPLPSPLTLSLPPFATLGLDRRKTKMQNALQVSRRKFNCLLLAFYLGALAPRVPARGRALSAIYNPPDKGREIRRCIIHFSTWETFQKFPSPFRDTRSLRRRARRAQYLTRTEERNSLICGKRKHDPPAYPSPNLFPVSRNYGEIKMIPRIKPRIVFA